MGRLFLDARESVSRPPPPPAVGDVRAEWLVTSRNLLGGALTVRRRSRFEASAGEALPLSMVALADGPRCALLPASDVGVGLECG